MTTKKMTRNERLAYMKGLITRNSEPLQENNEENAISLMLEQNELLQSVKADVLKELI